MENIKCFLKSNVLTFRVFSKPKCYIYVTPRPERVKVQSQFGEIGLCERKEKCQTNAKSTRQPAS